MERDSLVISYIERQFGYSYEEAEAAWNSPQNDPAQKGYCALLMAVAATTEDE